MDQASTATDGGVVAFGGFNTMGRGIACPGHDFSRVGQLWGECHQQLAALNPDAQRLFGISWGIEGGSYYLACIEVPAGTELPEGMEQKEVPAGKYYRLHFHDSPDKMPAAFGRIFGELAPAAGVTPKPDGICLEEYGPGWHEEEAGKFNMDLYTQLG
jgi:predicted transcriptional regulator YdeE